MDNEAPHSLYRHWGKRLFDLGVALSLLAVLSPLLALLFVAVRLWLGSPAVFLQQRPGRDCRPFNIVKLRTMTDERDASGELRSDTERLTRLGRLLRATSLDELPELLNVIKGDMSLVGPRPLLMRYTPWFRPEERVRFTVRPGITGLAQVAGRNDLSWDARIAADVEYVSRCSLLLDVSILVRTGLKVLTRDGLRVDPGARMLNFDEERRGRGMMPHEPVGGVRGDA